MAGPQFSAALSTNKNLDQAIDEVCAEALASLGGTPDLAIVFVSHDHLDGFESLGEKVCDRLGTDALIGCSGESIAGVGREVESEPAVSLWLAKLPGSNLHTFHLTFENTPDGGTFLGWPDPLVDTWPAGTSIVALGEPYTFPADYFLHRLNEDQPGVLVSGGMASGASSPGESRVWVGRTAHKDGAAVLALHGAVRMRTIVSQGCRPIGHPFVITKCDKNVILELGGKPAMEQLQEIFNTLPTREQQAAQRGLHVGRVVSEYLDHFEPGDFLVRNVIGVSREHGAIAIGDFVRVGQTVQFHIRDAETADADLRQLLTKTKANGPEQSKALGALLFTCNGRGRRLFDVPDHDASVVADLLGRIPLAGFFAAGELGPVSNKNFMHGFTASVAIFEATDSARLQSG